MLVSLNHKFIYIHVWKAAGTSVRKALAPYSEVNLLDSKFIQSLRWRNYYFAELFNRLATRTRFSTLIKKSLRLGVTDYHCNAEEAKYLLPTEIWNGCFKFSFVRNPWAREVSNYHFILGNSNNPHHDFVKDMGSFDAYLHEYLPIRKSLQYDYLSNSEGKILVDYIGKIESVDKDFRHVVELLGIENNMHKINTSKHEDYRQYYSDKTAELVSEIFQKDIEAFGYDF